MKKNLIFTAIQLTLSCVLLFGLSSCGLKQKIEMPVLDR
ncbi:hypothetical protein Sarmat_00169 [Rickettsiales endosymbiont of Paramecium tredecaurelia]|nr:hypothetical protein [Candidatus Sarmatiella mevalonica]